MKLYQRIKRNSVLLLLIGAATVGLILLLFWPKEAKKDILQTADSGETEASAEDNAHQETPSQTNETAERTDAPVKETTALESESETSSEPAELDEVTKPEEPAEPESTVAQEETVGGSPEVSTEQEEETTEAASQLPPEDDSQSDTKPTEPEDEVAYEDITCDRFAGFSGQFVEDGRDDLVENVAAVLVTNHSDRFLNFAVLTYDIDGIPAVFVVSGLPAGESAWVMEYTRLTVSDNSVFTYEDSITSFRDTVMVTTDQVTITADGSSLIAINNTTETLEDVYVYYKTVHTDGNFFGGITYRVDFGDLEPGVPLETIAGHYAEDSSRIIRISWRGSD
ncbi:MAG: hypothetical protein IJZ85_10655 [Lachnospiraceae bacterium]|nr:hypothetical protein [Lachnospiraceae bacterium]